MRAPLVASLSLLSTALSAQSLQVMPAAFTDTPASAVTSWPFGLATQNRIQYLYAASETGFTAPAVILAIEVRAQENTINPAKANIDLQIELSTTSVAPIAASSTFASNHGTNRTAVYTRKMTSVPATTAAYVGQYLGPLFLDVPFVYFPSAGNLLVDYDIASQPAGNWQIDTPYLALAVHAGVGSGCNGLNATSSGGLVGNTPLLYGMTGGQSLAPAVLLLGLRELQAPFPVPGNPACMVFQELPVVVSTTLTATGTASLSLPVPNDPFLRGKAIYGQFAAIAGTRIDTTNSQRALLGATYDVTRIYNNSSNTSPTGTVQASVGIVTRLLH